jgi:hypothetical protein
MPSSERAPYDAPPIRSRDVREPIPARKEVIPMLLAEALAARKDALKQVVDLSERLAAAAVRYEDQDGPIEDAATLVGLLDERLDTAESLAVRINRTNNAARLTFDGRDLTIMEAIALRERLTLEARARRGAVEAVEAATGSGSTGRRGRAVPWTGRRTKDDIRELATIDLPAERRLADGLSETVRRLDMALQQKNWTTELLA